ncbi:Hsp70 family protein [Agromyces sp. NPDC056379]|uniref:Hsp70 family protein n=1 Tax=unclassified Agromyces TaxID=2639701 RepID=UPI0035E300F7
MWFAKMGDISYALAVDIGTSRVAAATAEFERDGSISASPFALGRKGDSVATVVFVADGGDLLFGDAAERRGVAQPERLVREFKRSVGDGVPLVVGGRTLSPETLYAATFASVVDTVTERMGSRPDAISLTYPTAWGAHRLGLIRTALVRLGIDEVSLITEPEAAARQYEAMRPLEPGQSIAVYDLGGGTFDAVVLRKGHDSDFALAGEPAGMDDLGGANFDDDVMRHVIATSGLDVSTLSVDDPDVRLALSQLRRESIDAKEALSFDSEATIPVLVPPSRSSVRLTRSEFEQMIDGALDRTLDVLERAIDSADLTPDQLEAILLIGGSSRIPLVAQRLSERFDRPLAVDADPKASIALGAARTALGRSSESPVAVAAPVAVAVSAPVAVSAAGALATLDGEDRAVDNDAGIEAEASTGRGFQLARIAGALGLRRESARASTRLSPWLMAGAVALISGAIVFGGTMAAGWRVTDYDNAASVDGDGTSDTSGVVPWPMTDPATRAFAPFAKILPPGAPIGEPGLFERAEDPVDARRPNSNLPGEDLPQARPGVPGTKAPTSPTSPVRAVDQPVGTTPPVDDPIPPADDPTTPPTTEPPAPDPTPDPPAPDPTPEPTPDPPAPEPTPDPPAPDPTPDPPTTDPTPDPAAPDPTPDPT